MKTKPCPSDTGALLAWHRERFGSATMTAPTPPGNAYVPAVDPAAPAVVGTPGAVVVPATVERTFTQAELTAIAAREKDQGERAARRQVAEALGIDPSAFDPAQVRAVLDQARTAESAHLSETERAAREAAADRAAAAKERADAAQDRLDARKERLLTNAGVTDPAALAVAVPAFHITADDDDAAAQATIDKLKQSVPGLFGSTTPPPPVPPAPSGAPSGTPPRPTPQGDAYARGAERAKQTRPKPPEWS